MTVLSSLLLYALAAGAPPTPDHAGALAPFLDGRTVAVCHLNLAVDTDALAARVAAVAKLDPRLLAGPKREVGSLLKDLTAAGARDLYVVVSLADVPEEPPFVVVPLPRGADGRALSERLGRAPFFAGPLRPEKIGPAVVVASTATRKRLRALKPAPRPEVARALERGRGVGQVVLVPTADTARIFEELLPTLPDEVGGGSIKTLTRGLRWLSVSLDRPPKLVVRVTLQAADAASARALNDLLGRATKALAGNEAVRKRLPGLSKLLAPAPTVAGDRLLLTLTEKELAPLAPLLMGALVDWQRDRAARPLRRVLLGLHRYESAHKQFPAAASYDRAGRPLLSWRVAILPYLGEEALHKQFKLDEPWDSPHNRKLLAKMPEAFRPAQEKLAAAHKTTILAPLGEATMFPGRRGVRMVEVLDGASNTIFLVDADDAHAVEWTRPKDLTYDPKDPFRGLSRRHGGKYLLGFADGTAHFLAPTAASLRALFTRAGGEDPNIELEDR
jgi:hypothetical protein